MMQSLAELETGTRREQRVLECARAPFSPCEVGAALRAKLAQVMAGVEQRTYMHTNLLKVCAARALHFYTCQHPNAQVRSSH